MKQRIAADRQLVERIGQAAERCVDVLRSGGKILFAGNGGSAADAQHLAAEFVGRFKRERSPLFALALTTDTSLLTAVGNDYGFETIFSRQIRGVGRGGDLFFGISTSGNSPNILNAMDACRELGITTIAMTGEGGGKMAQSADLLLAAPSAETPRIQESHIMMGHIICELVDGVMSAEQGEER